MAFFGTKCVDGDCIGVVVLTGTTTIIGRIAGLAATATQAETTLSIDLHKFMVYIAWLSIILGGVFFALGFALGTDVLTNFVYAIGIIVANVPEGLLITLTVTLSAAATRMAAKNVLVKNLSSVETLGSTSCICSDKTGTLTMNQMTPVHSYIFGKDFDCSLGKDEYELELSKNKNISKRDYSDPGVVMFSKYIALSSTAEILEPTREDILNHVAKILKISPNEVTNEMIEYNSDKPILLRERKTIFGNPTEAGIIKFIASVVDCKQVREDYPMAFEIPFSSVVKYNLVIRKVLKPDKTFSHFLVIMKGAAEKIILRCNKINVDGKVEEMTEEHKGELQKRNKGYATQAERVLGLAYLELDPIQYPESFIFISNPEERNIPTSELVFLGLISLYDPARPGVPESVNICQVAGIKVIMITGDQPDTAKAIAHKCNIITDLSLEYDNMVKSGCDKDYAMENCRVLSLKKVYIGNCYTRRRSCTKT